MYIYQCEFEKVGNNFFINCKTKQNIKSLFGLKENFRGKYCPDLELS